MSVGGRIIELLAIAAVVMVVQALLHRMQRKNAAAQSGWQYLTPGPMAWTGLVLGFGLTALLSYIYLFVGSHRPDADFQMHVLLFLTVAFNLITIFIAYTTLVEEVRWNDAYIERRTLLFERRRMTWHELAMFGVESTGYWWIRSSDGPRIRFSPYSHGFRALLSKIAQHLPTDLPPAELETVQQALLARAAVSANRPRSPQ